MSIKNRNCIKYRFMYYTQGNAGIKNKVWVILWLIMQFIIKYKIKWQDKRIRPWILLGYPVCRICQHSILWKYLCDRSKIVYVHHSSFKCEHLMSHSAFILPLRLQVILCCDSAYPNTIFSTFVICLGNTNMLKQTIEQ